MRVVIKWAFIFLALLVLPGASRGAATPEQRALAAADDSFRLGLWERAEKQYATFVEQFPKSEDKAQALLRQGQSQWQMGHYTNAVALLSGRIREAGRLADEFQFWLGEAQFQAGNFQAAAEAYARLTRDYTNSPHWLAAAYSEALARSRLGEWTKVDDLLRLPDGVFQQAATREPTNEFVLRGKLLLGEAQLARNDLPAVEETARGLAGQTMQPELEWRRQYLLCRAQLAGDRLTEALQTTTNMVPLAAAIGQRDLQAETALLRGGILEKLKDFDAAIAAYEGNLTEEMPVERRRQAGLKIVELLLSRNRVAAAVQRLEKFVSDYAKDSAVDVAMLTVGELHLKEFLAAGDTNRVELVATNGVKGFPAYPNDLQQAFAQFDWITKNFPRSTVLGRAMLDRAWCYVVNGQQAESRAAFQLAAEKLPLSFEQALARYKWADCQFQSGDAAGALTNYFVVLTNYPAIALVKKELAEPTLYQIVRASLAANNLEVATNAIGQILVEYPEGFYCDRALLLTGEKVTRAGMPAQARGIFSAALKLPVASPLTPEIRLAIARTYEQEKNWSQAAAEYEHWLADNPDSPQRELVEYTRAWSLARAGQGAEALAAFSGFVTQHPTNDLAPLAQNWVADHFLQEGDYKNAEANYQLLFQKWPPSALTYSARLMAGRAAMARLGYSEAVAYFTKLINDQACPPEFVAQAFYEYGDVTMRMEAASTENAYTNFWRAIPIFSKIPQLYPTNGLVPLAWGQIGNCYMQLGSQDATWYTNALSAYQKVFDFPAATVVARSQAEFGMAAVLEKQSLGLPVEQQKPLLKQAFDHYLNVALGVNLKENEVSDPFWAAKAGREAARLAETLGEWQQAANLYQRLAEMFPPLKSQMEKKLARARANLGNANR